MSARLALALALLAGCDDTIVDLGIDAPADAPSIDAPMCRCRVNPCRTAGDCGLTGGTCGADFYCTGDFGVCTTNADCQATSTASVCTASATSTALCM